MTRRNRIALVAGLAMGIAGILIAVVGSSVAAFILTPDTPLDEKTLASHMKSIQLMGNVSSIIFVAGILIAVSGGIFSFTVWARAFISGSQQRTPKPGDLV